MAFTPVPPTPASGPSPSYIWWTTDTKLLWVYDTGWEQFSTLGAALTLTGVISPTAVAADQNNYSPTGLATCSIMRLTASSTYNITGLLAPSTGGQVLLIANIGSNTITFKNESASSTAANRFDLTADLALAASAACVLFYDVTSARWRAAGGAGGGGSGTVTSVATGTGLTGGTITTTGTLDLAAVTAHKLMIGTGSAGAPGVVAVGATNTVLHGNTGADPTFSAVVTADITNSNVTLAKIANAAANSVLLGAGASGSGSAYVEIALGTGLTMTGTTLSASGGSGTVTSVATGGGLSGGTITTTGTLVLAAVTNHAVALGTGSTGALGTAAPGASLYPLVSTGATTDPAFGQITTGALSDYSTGTWTPVVKFGGATTGITYSIQIGNYVKIGKLVFIEMSIQLSSKGSATGNATITGLPYAAVSTASTFQNTPGMTGTLPSPLPFGYIGIAAGVADTAMGLYVPVETAVTNSTFTDTTQLIVNFCYLAA